MNDAELRARLRALDLDEETDVTGWEADFIESVVYKYEGPLSEKQREAAAKILETYGYDDS